MEQIKIIFFALASFFAIEDGRIAADKTTVIIYPENKEIEIIQENLFAVIQSEKDSTLVLEQWNNILFWKEKNIAWAKELDNFNVKNFYLTTNKKTIQPYLILGYCDEKDLRKMGIWYNKEKNKFSINESPQYNIKTESGELMGNYWFFDGKEDFSFTVEPFLEFPKKYQENKQYLSELLKESKN